METIPFLTLAATQVVLEDIKWNKYLRKRTTNPVWYNLYVISKNYNS